MSDQEEIYATLIEIKAQPTELYKILKFESLVSGGGEAKQVISEGYVYLNGEVETRKRKKVYAGDLIYFNEQYFQVALKGALSESELVEQSDVDVSATVSAVTKKPTDVQGQAVQHVTSQKEVSKKTRKPISF